MPFQAYLMPTTASPDRTHVAAEVRAAILAHDGAIAADGVTVRTREGIRVTLGRDGDAFLFDQLAPSLCQIIFDAALRTNSTIDRGGSDVIPLKVKGSTGVPRYADETDVQTDPIENANALCMRLKRNLHDWRRTIRDMQIQGLMGQDEELLEPPPAPGTEPVVTADTTGVADHCQAMAKDMTAKYGWTFDPVVISRNPRWGVVWRADSVMPESPEYRFRRICWQIPHPQGGVKYMLEDRPLDMFDPTQSVGPLQGTKAPSATATALRK